MSIRTAKRGVAMCCSSTIELDGILYAAISRMYPKRAIFMLVDENGSAVHYKSFKTSDRGAWSQRSASTGHKLFFSNFQTKSNE